MPFSRGPSATDERLVYRPTVMNVEAYWLMSLAIFYIYIRTSITTINVKV